MRSCPECAATYPDDYAICPKDGAPLQDTTLWQIGTVVRGKYLIQSRLGEGGMAIVYKAHHELLDESRALKVIRPDLARDTEFMTRFKNEAIMARKLNHPNAVRVDDLDIAEDGLPFIAMELVVGDTLKTLVQQTGPLPVTLVLHIASPLCEALDAAHKLGLIHRDIKPENIVLVAQREGPPVPKILDFGISRLREETAQAKGLTQTGMVIGTPEYMSPEQVMGKRRIEIDGRSDLYSLGVVMYRMLTGELPFQGESTMEMILQHLKTPPKAPHQLKPGLGIPEAVSSIVMKALEKDRENRYATGAEMAAAIKKTLRKIEWASVRKAAASVDAKSDAPGSPAVRSSAAPARPAPLGAAAAPAPPAAEKPIYRSFARTGPHPKEFPTRWVLTAVAVAVLMGGAFAAWKYFKSWPSAKQAAGPPAGTAKSEPAKTTELSPSGGQKTVETPKVGPVSPAPNGQRPGERKKLSYDEQAKIVELNSLAAIYYREGGCGKALPIYEQVLEIDPRDPRAYAAVRKCYSKARNGVLITPAPTTTPDTSPSP
ncbi:MAG TPA: serine/threonine-protein kinase [Terriglobia bacterium]|nr:serine/threonine-protein kinase [Terriglobia bacterium]